MVKSDLTGIFDRARYVLTGLFDWTRSDLTGDRSIVSSMQGPVTQQLEDLLLFIHW